MITNDQLQTQLSLGAYAGATNPFGLPYTTLQTAINPGQFNPFAGVAQTGGISPFGQQGYAGIPNYGAIAQQQQLQQLQQQLQQLQQLASILASQAAIPPAGQMNPWQSQAQPNVFQNPLLGQNPLVNPMLAQQLALQAGSIYGQPQYGQIGSPFGQQNAPPFAQTPFAQTPFAQGGYPLAPQSWVGQQLPGQMHPHLLSQLAGRGLY